MLNDEPRLVELLLAQDESLVVQEVQVVTPAWMNKGAGWKLENLTSLLMGFSRAEVPICVLEVESGDVYVDTHEADLDVASLKGLKELYRRSSSKEAPDTMARAQ
ncbi:hypothetical protein FHW75_002493 [Pseudomonas sp. OG7]|nr:hypothetical protein [Pseudomonas sp. OG7]